MTTLSPEGCEREIIGQVLVYGVDALVRAELRPSDFLNPHHARIWRTALELHAAGKPVDLLLIADTLTEQKALDGIGGIAGLTAFTRSVVTADNLEHWADEVRRFAKKRQLCSTLSEYAQKALNEHDPDTVLEQAFASLARVAERRDDPTVSVRQAVRTTIKAKMQEAEKARSGDQGDRLLTGLDELDRLMGGLRRKVLTILAGGTSHGKSALARTIGMNIAMAGHGVHVFSTEDSTESYAERALADVGDLSLFRLSSQPEAMDAREWSRLNEAGSKLWNVNRWIVDDSAGLSAASIAMRVRKHKPKNKTKLVVVDYIQELRDPAVKPGGEWARQQHIALSLDGLLQLARVEDVAILVLSQLGREYAKEQRPPTLQDLRGQGELENRAACIMAIYRAERNERSTEKRMQLAGKAELLLLKLKGGRAPNQCALRFDGTTATFRSLGPEDEPMPVQQEMPVDRRAGVD